MFEVVQHNSYSKHATQLMSELLGKTQIKGVVPMNRMILRNCKVTKEVVEFSFLPFLYPLFLKSLPIFSWASLIVLLSHAPLLVSHVHRLRSLPTSHRRVYLFLNTTE